MRFEEIEYFCKKVDVHEPKKHGPKHGPKRIEPMSAPRPGENSRQTLTDWGLTEDEIEELIVAGVVHQADS